ncbi:hypothetical protein Droror1_Dr00022402 [Drosera rotundifolia]
MNRCGIQQTAMESSVETRSDGRRFIVCPKPRRPALFNFVLDEISGSKAGSELLDLIITKEGHELSRSNYQTASSPRFFSGSPPCRVSNPLIQDAHFRNAKLLLAPVSASPMRSPAPGSAASPSASRKGGCARANVGSKPAVRVEGFDCLAMDRRSCSIPALG